MIINWNTKYDPKTKEYVSRYRHNPDKACLSIGDMIIESDPNWGAGMIIKAEIREGQKKKDPKDKILVTDDEWRYLIRFPRVTRKRGDKMETHAIEVWWFEKQIRTYIDNQMLKIQKAGNKIHESRSEDENS